MVKIGTLTVPVIGVASRPLEVAQAQQRAHPTAWPYARGTWRPQATDALIAADGGWHNPTPQEQVPCA